MPMWESTYDLIVYEIREREEEGCDVKGFRERADACRESESDLMRLYEDLSRLLVRPDYPYREPNGLEEILSAADSPEKGEGFPGNDRALSDKLYGAWLGRCAGCALGKPVERHPFVAGNKEKRGYELIRDWLEGADAYPLSDYFPGSSSSSQLSLVCPDSQKERIRFMETDDDIRYLVLALLLNERKGNDFTPEDVRDNWLSLLPVYETFTAERIAYLNSMNCTLPDLESRRTYTSTYLNPYREWIGAQIRVDHYGYVNAGFPETAARTAYQDASFSHTKNGVYGAMFVAAMIAAAFTEPDPERCVRIGCSVIPARSRLREALEKAIAIGKEAGSREELFRMLWDAFSSYAWVHTINNAAAVAASLVFARGDFETAIACAVANGWDTDCNGATVGSVMGAILGADALPDKWIAPLHDTLYSAIPDFHPVSISSCAERSLRLYRKLHP
ncbi:MAG: ADP-ribosylglycohydrolase family protein [Clostridia bacterium]|nr:ADP-ribosylglycohydrolase family protein [Clostridia bacterium]